MGLKKKMEDTELNSVSTESAAIRSPPDYIGRIIC